MSVSLPTINKNTAFTFGAILLLLCFLLFPEYSFASEGSGGGLPYEDWLTKLRQSVTGPVAFTISIIGIIVAGAVLIFGGELNAFFRTLVFLVLLMALLVGAQNMMSSLFGRGAELSSGVNNMGVIAALALNALVLTALAIRRLFNSSTIKYLKESV